MATRVRNLGSLSVSLTAEAATFFSVMKNAEKQITQFNTAVNNAAKATKRIFAEAGIDKQHIFDAHQAESLRAIGQAVTEVSNQTKHLHKVLGLVGSNLNKALGAVEAPAKNATKAVAETNVQLAKMQQQSQKAFDGLQALTKKSSARQGVSAAGIFSTSEDEKNQLSAGKTKVERFTDAEGVRPLTVRRTLAKVNLFAEELRRIYKQIDNIHNAAIANTKAAVAKGVKTEEEGAAREVEIANSRLEARKRFAASALRLLGKGQDKDKQFQPAFQDKGLLFGDDPIVERFIENANPNGVFFNALDGMKSGLIQLSDKFVQVGKSSDKTGEGIQHVRGATAEFLSTVGGMADAVQQLRAEDDALEAEGGFGDKFLERAPEKFKSAFDKIDTSIAKGRESLKKFNDALQSGEVTKGRQDDLKKQAQKIAEQLNEVATLRDSTVANLGQRVLETKLSPAATKEVDALKEKTQALDSSSSKLEKQLTKTGEAGNRSGGSFLRLSSLFRDLSGGGAGLAGVFKNLASSIDFTLGAIAEFYIARQILNLFIGTLKAVTSAFPAFEDSIQRVAAIVGGADEHSLNRSIVRLSAAARNLAKSTIIPVTEAAQALQTLSQAGLSAGEATRALEPVIALAVGGVSSLEEAVKLATSVMKAFRLEASALDGVANVLVATVNNSKSTIEDLNTAFNFAGATAATVGISYQDLAAVVGTLADNGVRASTQGTTFRRVIGALIEPTSKARQVFKELGIDLADLNPVTNDLGDILRRLKDAGFSAADAFRAFDTRIASSAALLIQNADHFERLQLKITATNAAYLAMDRRQQSLFSQWQIIQNQLNDLSISFGEGLAPALRFVTSLTRDFLDALNDLLPAIVFINAALISMALTLGAVYVFNILNATRVTGLFATAIFKAKGALTTFLTLIRSNPYLAVFSVAIAALSALWFRNAAATEANIKRQDEITEALLESNEALTTITESLETFTKTLKDAQPGTLEYSLALTGIDDALFNLVLRYPEAATKAREFQAALKSGDFVGATADIKNFYDELIHSGVELTEAQKTQLEIALKVTAARKEARGLGQNVARNDGVDLAEGLAEKGQDLAITVGKLTFKDKPKLVAKIGKEFGEIIQSAASDPQFDEVEFQASLGKLFAGYAGNKNRHGDMRVRQWVEEEAAIVKTPEFKRSIAVIVDQVRSLRAAAEQGKQGLRTPGLSGKDLDAQTKRTREVEAQAQAEIDADTAGLRRGDKRRKAWVEERVKVAALSIELEAFATKLEGTPGVKPFVDTFIGDLKNVKTLEELNTLVKGLEKSTQQATQGRVGGGFDTVFKKIELIKREFAAQASIAAGQDEEAGTKRTSDETIALIKKEGAERRRQLIESLKGVTDEAAFAAKINQIIENRFETETRIAELKSGEERAIALEGIAASRLLETEKEREAVLEEISAHYKIEAARLEEQASSRRELALLDLEIDKERRKGRFISPSLSGEKKKDDEKVLEIEKEEKLAEIQASEKSLIQRQLELAGARSAFNADLVKKTQAAVEAETNRLRILERELELIKEQTKNIDEQNDVIVNVGDKLNSVITDAFEGAIAGTKKFNFDSIWKSAKQSFVKELTKGFAEVLVKKLGFDKEINLNFLQLGEKGGEDLKEGVVEKGLGGILGAVGEFVKSFVNKLDSAHLPSGATDSRAEEGYIKSLGQELPKDTEVVGPSETFRPTEEETGKADQVNSEANSLQETFQKLLLVAAAIGIIFKSVMSALKEADKIKEVAPGDETDKTAKTLKAAGAAIIATTVIAGAVLGATVGAAAFGVGAIVGAAVGAAVGGIIGSAISKAISKAVISGTKEAKEGALKQRELNEKVGKNLVLQLTTLGASTTGGGQAALQGIGLIPNIERIFDDILKKILEDIGIRLDFELRGRQLGAGLSGPAASRAKEFFGPGTEAGKDARTVAELFAALIGTGGDRERIERFFGLIANNAAKLKDNLEEASKFVLQLAARIFRGDFGDFFITIESLFRAGNERITGTFTRQLTLLKKVFQDSFPTVDLDLLVEEVVQAASLRGLGPKRQKANQKAVIEASASFKSNSDFDIAFAGFVDSLKSSIKESIFGGFIEAFASKSPVGIAIAGFFGRVQKEIKKLTKKADFTPESFEILLGSIREQANVAALIFEQNREELQRMFQIVEEMEEIIDDIIKTPVQKEIERLDLLKQTMDTIFGAAQAIFDIIQKVASFKARLEQTLFEATTGETDPGSAPGLAAIFKQAAQESFVKFVAFTQGLTPESAAGQEEAIIGLAESALNSLDNWLNATIDTIVGKFEPAIKLAESAASALDGVQAALKSILRGRDDVSPSEKLASIDQSLKEQRQLMLSGTPEEQIKAAGELQKLLSEKLGLSAELLDTSGPIYRGIVNDVQQELESLTEFLRDNFGDPEDLQKKMEEEIRLAREEASGYYTYIQEVIAPFYQSYETRINEQFTKLGILLRTTLGLPEGSSFADVISAATTASIKDLETFLENAGVITAGGDPDKLPDSGGNYTARTDAVSLLDQKVGSRLTERIKTLFPDPEVEIPVTVLQDAMLAGINALQGALNPERQEQAELKFQDLEARIYGLSALLPASINFEIVAKGFAWLQSAIGKFALPFLDGKVALNTPFGEAFKSVITASLPSLASGGLAMSELFARIGEKGPEAVIPLSGPVMMRLADSILSAIDQRSPSTMLSNSGVLNPGSTGAGGGDTNISINILPGAIQTTVNGNNSDEIKKLPEKQLEALEHSFRYGKLRKVIKELQQGTL